jgi:hypothetical protein
MVSAMLIQEYYARNQADHAVACRPVLDALLPGLRSRTRRLLRVADDVLY